MEGITKRRKKHSRKGSTKRKTRRSGLSGLTGFDASRPADKLMTAGLVVAGLAAGAATGAFAGRYAIIPGIGALCLSPFFGKRAMPALAAAGAAMIATPAVLKPGQESTKEGTTKFLEEGVHRAKNAVMGLADRAMLKSELSGLGDVTYYTGHSTAAESYGNGVGGLGNAQFDSVEMNVQQPTSTLSGEVGEPYSSDEIGNILM